MGRKDTTKWFHFYFFWLCSTGNSTRHSVITYMGKESEKEEICIYIPESLCMSVSTWNEHNTVNQIDFNMKNKLKKDKKDNFIVLVWLHFIFNISLIFKIKIEFLYHSIHYFKVYNLMAIGVFTRLYTHHTYSRAIHHPLKKPCP